MVDPIITPAIMFCVGAGTIAVIGVGSVSSAAAFVHSVFKDKKVKQAVSNGNNHGQTHYILAEPSGPSSYGHQAPVWYGTTPPQPPPGYSLQSSGVLHTLPPPVQNYPPLSNYYPPPSNYYAPPSGPCGHQQTSYSQGPAFALGRGSRISKLLHDIANFLG